MAAETDEAERLLHFWVELANHRCDCAKLTALGLEDLLTLFDCHALLQRESLEKHVTLVSISVSLWLW